MPTVAPPVFLDVHRYFQRMDRFDVEKRACRASSGVAGQVAGASRCHGIHSSKTDDHTMFGTLQYLEDHPS